MVTKVVKLSEFKPQNVSFSVPKSNKYGGKVVYVNYDYEDGESTKPLRIQLPKLKTPFGISGWDKDRADKKDTSPSENSNDTLELSIEDSKELLDKFEEFDQMAINQGVLNSKDFFKKKYDAAYVKMQYNSPVRYYENQDGDRDHKYPPRFKTKLYKTPDFKYRTQVFNSSKELLDMNVYNHNEILPKGSSCIALVECTGIWIVNDKFGMSFKPAQLKVYKTDLALKDYSFIDESESEGEDEDYISEQ